MEEADYKEAREARSVQMRLTLPVRAYEYLTHLKLNTVIGGSENEIAAHLLVQHLHEMKMRQFVEPPAQGSEPRPLPERKFLATG
ncbi:MAG TPA: hypothetical protein VGG48_07695 [Rhizomicrobium sp.]